jgi:23S rRNA pseudouridine2605 synthase
MTTDQDGVRLQKVLAAAGVGSRRACEELIDEGRVTVNGQTVRGQGMRVDPDASIIEVDGERIITRPDMVYLAANKPIGMLSAMSDDRNRPTLADLVGERTERLFHVGRLDQDTEGLLLLTNDGELSHRLMHPAYEVRKVYLAEVLGPIPRSLGRTLKAGVELEDGPLAVDDFKVVDVAAGRAVVQVTVHEGRQRMVRRLLEHVGHPVSRLVRTEFGPVILGTLRAGRVRHLTRGEVSSLHHQVKL